MPTKTMTKSDLAAELGSAMLRIAKGAKRSVRAEYERLGLTVPQAMVLHTLAAPTSGCRHASWDVNATCSHRP